MDVIETFKQVMNFLEKENWEAAEVCLNEVEENIPDTGEMQKFAGQLYQRIGADQKALAFLERAQNLVPDDNSIILSLGFHYLDNAEPEKAAAYFKTYLGTHPGSQDALCHLGRAYDLAGDRVIAEQTLRDAVEIDPTSIEPQLHFGRVLILNGKFVEARACFETVNTHHPGYFLAETGARRAQAFIDGKVVTNIERKAENPATVVCVKFGTKYSAEYVNRLFAMVQRWSSIDVDFVCFTEDASGLADGVRALPLPEKGPNGEALLGWWNKLSLFRPDIPDVGSHMLYFDLDVVLTGSIDPLLFYDSDFTIIDNPYTPSFNSSIMRFKTGSRPEVWQDFNDKMAEHLPGDQDWLAIKVPDADLWPEDWCVLYRLHAAEKVPEGARAVCFSWRPNPDDYPAEWIKEIWY